MDWREFSDHEDQTLNEIEFFKKMDMSDKEVFPMIGYEFVKGKQTIVMKKCTPISDVSSSVEHLDDCDDDFILDVGDIVGANEYSINHVRFFIDDYNLIDIHTGNLAVDEDNNLVIIDVGL